MTSIFVSPPGTIGKRFATCNAENTEENRRVYRQLLFDSDDASVTEHISGVIMFHETFYQKNDAGKLFTDVLKGKGIVPGIKVGF